MTEASSSRKLLFILSDQYGELDMAQYFVAEQPFAPNVCFMVPEKLKAASAAMAGDVQVYSRLDALEKQVDSLDPDIVFLFSAYLFFGDRLFSLSRDSSWLEATRRLVVALRAAGRVIVTSDPFCGLAGRVKPWSFRIVSSGLFPDDSRQRILAPLRSAMAYVQCRRLTRVLRDLPHLYPGTGPSKRRASTALGFFNPAWLDAHAGAPQSRNSLVDASGAASRSWLFLLSKSDFIIQSNLHGARLIEDICARLTDAHRHGRIGMLIAPAALLEQVRQRLDPQVEARLREELPYDEFMTELRGCEAAFYWNVFSFSTLPRILRGQPTFFFDKGHLSRLVRGYYEAAVECYLAGTEPVFLSVSEPLTPSKLRIFEPRLRAQSTKVAGQLERARSPDEIIGQLVAVPTVSG